MVPLSLSHLTVLEVAPPRLFELAAQAGYQSVGIRAHPAAPGGVNYPLDARGVRRWRRALVDAGVTVNDIEFVPITAEFNAGAQRPMLALGAELGARRLSVGGDDPDAARLADRFGALCDLAAGVGMDVELEFMRWRHVATLADALAVVARAARPNGKVLVDLLHLVRSGGGASDLAAVDAERIGSVQLSDAPLADPTDARIVEEAREARLFPGDGELPLLDLLDALPANVLLAVEVPTARSRPGLLPLERARRAAAASRELLAAWRPRGLTARR